MTIQELNLSTRLLNCLRREGIKTVDQIIERREREILRIPNIGKKTLNELKEVLKQRGLTLKKEF